MKPGLLAAWRLLLLMRGRVQDLQASPFATASRAFCSPQLPPIKMAQDPSVPKPGSPRKRVSTLSSIVEVAPTSEGCFPASPGTPVSTDKVWRCPPCADPSKALSRAIHSDEVSTWDRQPPAGGHVEAEWRTCVCQGCLYAHGALHHRCSLSALWE